MYGLPPDQWREISFTKRLVAQLSRCLPETARLRFCGLPAGVVSVADAGNAVEALEIRGEEGLYRVPRGWIWSRGAQLDEHARIVGEISPGVNRPPAWWFVRRQKFLPQIVDCPGTVFSMSGDDADNLYHWTFDVMPRLRLLDPARRRQVRVLARLRHPFHRASLEAAGFLPASIIPAESRTLYRTEELLAASVVKGVTPANLACAREIYLRVTQSVPPAKTPVRLYISRARATSRKILNEQELLRVIEPLGFKSVLLETLPLAEQLALFRDAEAILSPTGAALAHLHLCRPGTHLLILMPQGCADFLYRDMARTIGLDPQLLDVPLAPGSNPDPVKADMILDQSCLAAIQSHLR
ncbi:MAG TPA: glycosyltransferase family 61 protein [Candidatus Methylacidiphilales bacterium]|nr:glycosyltransferase family 61 protein [Candidatus Methylacidiphilales bacterium]